MRKALDVTAFWWVYDEPSVCGKMMIGSKDQNHNDTQSTDTGAHTQVNSSDLETDLN